MIVALFNRKSDVGKTTVALDHAGRWSSQQFWIADRDAGRKGENENFWLDWSQQRANEGLTRSFEVIGLTPGAPRLEALEIACMVRRVGSGEPPRFAVRMRSARLGADVALAPCQPSPSGEGERVEIRKLQKKARFFRPGLHPRFVSNRYGPPARIVRERPKAVTKQDLPTPWGRVGRHVAFANFACSSRFPWKPPRDGLATRADDCASCRNHDRVRPQIRICITPERSRGPESLPRALGLRERRESRTIHRASDERRHDGIARPHRAYRVPATSDGQPRRRAILCARRFPQLLGDEADGRSHRS